MSRTHAPPLRRGRRVQVQRRTMRGRVHYITGLPAPGSHCTSFALADPAFIAQKILRLFFSSHRSFSLVIPAQAGIPSSHLKPPDTAIPRYDSAFAGMTKTSIPTSTTIFFAIHILVTNGPQCATIILIRTRQL